MPSARAADFRRAAARLGFRLVRQRGRHEQWKHSDGRLVTIPIHGSKEIGPPLFFRLLDQLGVDTTTFERLR